MNINQKPIQNQIIADAWSAYKDSLLKFVQSRVKSRAVAEDIVQEVFVKAILRSDGLNDTSNLRAWLYQVTRNQIIDYFRLKKPSASVPKELASKAFPVDGSELDRELTNCLLQMLKAVPEPYREALRLADVDGVKQKEIARQLGLSLSGAKSRIQRARQILKQELIGCCPVDVDSSGKVIDFEPSADCDGCS